MGKIMGTFIYPHPPIMVKEVGKEDTKKVAKSVNAALEGAERIAQLKPDTIIIVSPHGPLFGDAMSIIMDERLEGSLTKFGANDLKFSIENDIELATQIMKYADRENIFCVPITEDVRNSYKIEKGLDHGTTVPLYFINKKYEGYKLISITYSMLPVEDHYRLGIAIKDAVESLERKAVIIASGDLSHRLTPDAPGVFSSKGAEFDAEFLELVERGDAEGLLSIDEEFLECAGECGYRSTVVAFGCMDGCNIKGEILSYEGPFGVGYCIAELKGESCRGRRDALEKYIGDKKKKIKAIRGKEDPYVRLARHTLEAYVRDGAKRANLEGLPEEMLENRAGVFVSIKKNGQLRGCIGTIEPATESIAEEIMQNAISAGLKDPRFFPVEEEELGELVYSVDVLMKPEPIKSIEELDVKRYGLIVRSGRKSGLLLPNLEGVDTPEQQLDITLKKAGIEPHEKYTMERFEVIRHY